MKVAGLYVICAFIAGVYFNWTFARENGFAKWLMLGQIVPTAKAVAWPYFVFIDGENPWGYSYKPVSLKVADQKVGEDLDSLSNSYEICRRVIRDAQKFINNNPGNAHAAHDVGEVLAFIYARDKRLSAGLTSAVNSGVNQAVSALSQGETSEAAFRACVRPSFLTLRPEYASPEGRCQAEARPYLKFAQARDLGTSYSAALAAIGEVVGDMKVPMDVMGLAGAPTEIKQVLTSVYARKDETPAQISNSIYMACMQQKIR